MNEYQIEEKDGRFIVKINGEVLCDDARSILEAASLIEKERKRLEGFTDVSETV